MPIEHRFIQDLELLENDQIFCRNVIARQSNILIIGTFNPNDQAGELNNNAEWFYGRRRNKFWRYFPTALTGESLHILDGQQNYPQSWKDYCIDNNIVIIDLIKRIHTDELLVDFADGGINGLIENDLNNVEYFNIENAFKGVTFNKVIYSLKWTDNAIINLIAIRNIINDQLLDNNCIQGINQIKYPLTPSRGDAFNSWNDAVNGN